MATSSDCFRTDKCHFGPPKNKASRLSVPLSKTATAVLRSHRSRQNKEKNLATPQWQDGELVFPNRIGGLMNHNNLYYRDHKPP